MKLATGDVLRIGTNVYRLEWRDQEWGDSNNLWAQCDYQSKFIRISKSSPNHMRSLLHEAIHAIDMEHYLGLTDLESKGTHIIEILASHLSDFVCENDIDLREELEYGGAPRRRLVADKKETAARRRRRTGR